MNRIDLLQALIDDRFDGKQVALAKAIKRSPAQVNQWLRGYRPIGDGVAWHIEAVLKLPGYFRGADASEPTAIAEPPLPYEPNTAPGPDVRGLIPVISWVQAGAWHEAEDHYLPGEAAEWRPCPTSHGLRTYALRVHGDSMTAQFGKSYPAGCLIFVDPDQAGGVVSGDRVIAKLNGDAQVTFKVFVEDAGRRFLKPLNPQHPVITDKFRVIGKVIGKWEDD